MPLSSSSSFFFFLYFFLIFLPSITSSVLPGTGSLKHDLTFVLESRLTCFFETLNAGDQLRASLVSMDHEQQQLLQLRVTSPTGSLSDWQSGDYSASLSYNLTETGVYEFCVHSSIQSRVSLNIFAYNEEKLIAGVSAYTDLAQTGMNLKKSVLELNERLYKTLHAVKYATLSMARDERMQQRNAEYIERYTLAFIVLNLVIGGVQIYAIRRFFKDVNTGKIRI